MAMILLLAGCGGQSSPERTASAAASVAATTQPSAPAAAGSVTTLVANLDVGTGGMAVGPDGNLYVADIGPAPRRRGTKILRITPDGTPSVFVDDDRLSGASGMTFDAAGNLYQSAFNAKAVLRITPAGRLTEAASEVMIGPVGVVVRPDGTLFVADCPGSRILRVPPPGTGETEIFVQSASLSCPNGLVAADDGTLYVASFTGGAVHVVSPQGELQALTTLPGSNNGHLAWLPDGSLLVVGRGANQLFRVTLDGAFSVLAGSGERGTADGSLADATFAQPNGVAVGPDCTIYVNQAAVDTYANHPVAIRVITGAC